MLELPNGIRIYTNDEKFLLKTLESTKITRNFAKPQPEVWNFLGTVKTTHLGKRITHSIYEGEKSYKITSSQSKNPKIYATVAKDVVEKVYHHLKKSGRKLSTSTIENALHTSATTIHNALKVLRLKRKARLDMSGTKRQYLYKALQ